MKVLQHGGCSWRGERTVPHHLSQIFSTITTVLGPLVRCTPGGGGPHVTLGHNWYMLEGQWEVSMMKKEVEPTTSVYQSSHSILPTPMGYRWSEHAFNYGAEHQAGGCCPQDNGPLSLGDHNVPCAVCYRGCCDDSCTNYLPIILDPRVLWISYKHHSIFLVYNVWILCFFIISVICKPAAVTESDNLKLPCSHVTSTAMQHNCLQNG